MLLAYSRKKFQEIRPENPIDIRIQPPGGQFSLGPFDLTYLPMTHSTLEAQALAIRTKAGVLVHTGDWYLDPDPLIGLMSATDALRSLGEEGVHAVISDSTNIHEDKSHGSERSIYQHIHHLVAERSGRIALTCFASNLMRLESAVFAAHACGRLPVLVGRSMQRMVDVARQAGYLKNWPRYVHEDAGALLPPESTLLVCTGSQGELRAAMARIAMDSHPRIRLEAGDSVIFSSRAIPGNERAINKIQNHLIGRGIEVITEKNHPVHVSGHPPRSQIAQLYDWLKPHIVVPVHGEMIHLTEHAAYAQSLGIETVPVIKNGDILRLAPDPVTVIDHVPTGRVLIDGRRLVPMNDSFLQDRSQLMNHGVVIASLVLDKKSRVLCQVSTRGVLDKVETQKAKLEKIALDTVTELSRAKRSQSLEVAVQRALHQQIASISGKQPMIIVHALRM